MLQLGASTSLFMVSLSFFLSLPFVDLSSSLCIRQPFQLSVSRILPASAACSKRVREIDGKYSVGGL